MPTRAKAAQLACIGLLATALGGCQLAQQPGTRSIGPTASPFAEPSPTLSLAPSTAPTSTPNAPDFAISWSPTAWSSRVNGIVYDTELALWMAFGEKQMWTSTDGAIWEQHAVAGEQLNAEFGDQGSMVAAARMGDRLWAAGVWSGCCDNLSLLVWSSVDGKSWEIEPQGQFIGFWTHGIASNGSTLAISETFGIAGGGALLTSTDGRTWTEHHPGGSAGMLDVYGDGDGFVAVGYRSDPTMGYTQTIWFSADATNWVDVRLTGAKGVLSSVERRLDRAYVAAGVSDSGAISVWRSEDGLQWTRVDLEAPMISGETWPLVRLASFDTGYVLVALTSIGWQSWASNDGVVWGQMQPINGDRFTSFGPVAAMSNKKIIMFPIEGTFFSVGHLVPRD